MSPPSVQHASHRLGGWTISVKLNIDVQGHRTTADSRAFCDAPPARSDAAVVRRLRRAGCRSMIRSNMHELAFGVTGINEWAGTPVNPADASRIPGGSSSGCAVDVATGAARLGVGTDTGGSIRIPAAFCGVYGMKLPHDPQLLHGVVPLAPTLDHIGFTARCLADLATVAEAGTGEPVPQAPRLNIQFLQWAKPLLHADVDDLLRAVVTGLRGSGEEVAELPRDLPSSEDVVELTSTVLLHEAYRTLTTRLGPKLARVGADTAARLEQGARIAVDRYDSARSRRATLESRVKNVLGADGVIIEPTVPIPAPPRSPLPSAEDSVALVMHTRLANAIRLPAVTIPVLGPWGSLGIQCTATTVGVALAAAKRIAAVVPTSERVIEVTP